jgi:hypothetical protein
MLILRFTDDGDIDREAEAKIKGTDRFDERESVFCNRVKRQPMLAQPRLW